MLREFIWYSGMYCLKYAFSLYGILLYLWKSLLSLILDSTYNKNQQRKKMVIIGGGFAGCYSAKKLENHFDITFIDDKDYFEFTPSVPRCLVNPNHINDIQIKHSNYLDLKKIVVVRDKVVNLDKNFAYTKTGNKAEYDVLLICSGSTYNKPFKSKNVYKVVRGESFAKKHKEISNCSKILIIGGGIVGVETAAELLEEFPGKEVTLVHSGNYLMNRTEGLTKKIGNYCEEFLTKRGCKVYLNTRVEANQNTNQFQTSEGKTFEGDIVLLCTGIVPNSKFLKDTIYDSARNEKGFIKVTENLNLENHPNVFVCGDVADIKEEKLAQNAEISASTVVHNCLLLNKGKTNFKKYNVVNRPIVISLGKFYAIFLWGSWSLIGLFPAWMKVVIEYKVMIHYKFRTGLNLF